MSDASVNPNDRPKRAFLLLGVLVLLCLTTSCGSALSGVPLPTATSAIVVDPIFREFYAHLGSADVLGEPISLKHIEGNNTVQYLKKAKMIFNPAATARSRFSLAPLGTSLGALQPTLPAPEQSTPYYFGGHYIAPEFIPLYEKLADFAGLPVTEAVYNPVHRRYEQFFENVGFYRLEGEEEVHLLDYGLWACGVDCQVADASLDATIDVYPVIDSAFAPFVEKLGADFTGFAITHPYLNKEGAWEQTFSNVVLRRETDGDATRVSLRPLPGDLNILPDQPRLSSQDASFHFYSANGDKGYDVPAYFWDYITAHGGIEISGPPVTHLAPLKGVVLRQCFTRLCLMYDPQASPESHVRPEPLGYAYREINRLGQEPSPPTRTATPLKIKVWERHPVIDAGQAQEIGVSITQNERPLAGVASYLLLTLPDGKQKAYNLPPTNAEGISGTKVDPVTAANSTVILYKVCVPPAQWPETCVADSFVIWNNP